MDDVEIEWPRRAALVPTEPAAKLRRKIREVDMNPVHALGSIACAALLTIVAAPPVSAEGTFNLPPGAHFNRQKLERVGDYLRDQIAQGKIPGAIVLIRQHGKTVYHEHFGVRDVATKLPMTDDTIFRLFSMTKPITSVVAMMLIEQGKLKLDDPIAKYIPSFADVKVGVEKLADDGKKALELVPPKRPPTILDLMRQTSGITYGFYGDDMVRKTYLKANIYAGDFDNAEFAERIARLPLHDQPGTLWQYGHSTDVLGRIMEVVSRKSLLAIEKEKLFGPLGMRATGFYVTDMQKKKLIAKPMPNDSDFRVGFESYPDVLMKWESGGGGMVSTMADLARFSQMILNGGKLDISLNMRNPAAIELARRLCTEWADAVLENFAPGAMAKWGLDFESLAASKPDVVMASGCIWGNTGPERNYPGFGGQGAALSGYTHLTGWADRRPVGLSGTITDSLAPRFVAAALASAILHKERTGEGTYIDLSQVEAAIWTLGAWVAEESMGITRGRDGNRHPRMAPHGVFACADSGGVKDRWVALAVHSDDEWRTLAGIIGGPLELSLGQRLSDQDQLERLVTAWTSERTNLDAAEELQAAGLDAHEVSDFADAHVHPQLVSRRHFVPIEHPRMGATTYEENGFRLSKSGGGITQPGPMIGQHTEQVLIEFLGLSAQEVKDLSEGGALD